MRYIQKEDKLYPINEYIEKFGQPEQRSPKTSNIINRYFDAYESPVSGKVISNHAQRNEDMKEHNCVEYEPSMVAESERNAKNEQANLELQMDRDIEKTIRNMSSDQQGSLEQELRAGADLSVDRQ